MISTSKNAKTIELPSPESVCSSLPANETLLNFVEAARFNIRNILNGNDSRLLAIVGPCSIHDLDQSFAYGQKLRTLAEELSESLFIVMRVYFEKPRTQGGWKGYIKDPHLNGSSDMAKGILNARALLIKILELGLPTATEFLEPIVPAFLEELVCWSCVGSRTVESPIHRQLASGLAMPTGFKNSTHGDIRPALQGMIAASEPQTMVSIGKKGNASLLITKGNTDTHLVLRGGMHPNHSPAFIEKARSELIEFELNPRLIVDCSHGNSQKHHEKQPHVLESIIEQIRTGESSIVGFMLESNLEAGRQAHLKNKSKLRYGISITDSCLDWNSTEALLRKVASTIRAELL
jgi:3-deoxy-7-phosphoheptulonate synthase